MWIFEFDWIRNGAVNEGALDMDAADKSRRRTAFTVSHGKRRGRTQGRNAAKSRAVGGTCSRGNMIQRNIRDET